MGYDPILTTSMFLWLTCLHAMIQFVFCQGNKTVVENLSLLQNFRVKTDTPLITSFRYWILCARHGRRPVVTGLHMFGLIILPLAIIYALLGWAKKLKRSKCWWGQNSPACRFSGYVVMKFSQAHKQSKSWLRPCEVFPCQIMNFPQAARLTPTSSHIWLFLSFIAPYPPPSIPSLVVDSKGLLQFPWVSLRC